MATQEQTKSRTELKKPTLWKVVILNDDYTPMDFVILCLMKIFKKNPEDAFRLMLAVHEQGRGVAGVYPFSIADEKRNEINSFARANKHPLTTEIEEA